MSKPMSRETKETNDSGGVPTMVFPYHVGSAVRAFTTPLLFAGRLACSVPGWVSSNPQQAFAKVGTQAARTGHILDPFFRAMAHEFRIAMAEADDTLALREKNQG